MFGVHDVSHCAYATVPTAAGDLTLSLRSSADCAAAIRNCYTAFESAGT